MKKVITVTFGDVDLSPYFIVSNITMPFLYKDNKYDQVGLSDGEQLTYSRNAKTPITIEGTILSENSDLTVAETRDHLISLLSGNVTKQLKLSNYPDRYFDAIFEGTQEYDGTFDYIAKVDLVFMVPDGIAHSVATKTFDNMPYKNVPVNFAIASHASGSNTTSKDAYPIHMQLSEDLSGKTITTVAKVIVTNYQGKVDSTNSIGPYIDVKDGPSTGAWSGLINQIPITGNGVYTLGPKTMTKHPLTGTTNQIDVEMYNLNATIEVWVKVELGTTASPWSPNPADPEYYTDTITVHNGGTYPVEPVITATMHADNGVVAFVNDQGSVLQFGSPSEIDGVVRQKSERVYYFDFENEPKGIVMNDGALTYPNYRDNPSTPNKQKGIFSYGRPDGYDNAIAYPNTERNPSNYWSGPSMSGKLAANSNGKQNGNFEWRNLIRFATMTNWAGRVEFNLTYEGKIVASLALYDQSTTDDQVMFEGKIHDGNDARMLFHEALPRDLYSRANSFAVISKMGDQLTFRIDRVGGGNVIRPFTIAGFGALPVDGWTVWFSAFSDVLEANMGWQDSYFDWVNVDYWTDVPNRFKEGDVVKIDVAKRVVSLNGAEDPTLQTVGNNWEGFQLLPGKNTIQVLQSDWAKRYMCQVEWQEAWL